MNSAPGKLRLGMGGVTMKGSWPLDTKYPRRNHSSKSKGWPVKGARTSRTTSPRSRGRRIFRGALEFNKQSASLVLAIFGWLNRVKLYTRGSVFLPKYRDLIV